MVNKKTRMLSSQILVTLCFLIFFPLLSQAGVTLTVEDGSGLPGSTDNPVAVSLDNPDVQIGGVQLDVCELIVDEDSYLTVTDVTITERTTGFTCITNNLEDGCVRVILFSSLDDLIEEGTGPIFTLRYDVSEEAPSGECRDLNPENVVVSDEDGYSLEVTSVTGRFCFPCTNDEDCDDGLYCNGEDTCMSGVCVHPGDPCPSGTECNEETCDPITTTTTTTPPTTTTTILPSYEVSISPSLATLDSDATLQFSAKTTYGGEEVEGNYSWEIVPESTIGSTIDENGLFTAGENTTESDIEETVKVTDTTHQNKTATATVTIKVKKIPTPECEVTINPSSATVSSGDTLSLVASTIGDDCSPGDYEWSIDNSEIGSMIGQEGNYTAGSNDTGSQVTDLITVVDHANLDINGSATINVEVEDSQKTVTIFPDKLLGSRWIPLLYFLLIAGGDNTFDLSSTISFEPGKDILGLGGMGFGDIFLALVFLGANPEEGTVTVSISTGGEVVTGEITIGLLPFPFAEDYLDLAQSYVEISFDTHTLFDEHSIGENPL